MTEIIKDTLTNPLFGISLTIFCFYLGKMISDKIKLSIANPLVFSVILITIIIKVFKIPIDYYNIGGEIITLFMAPATTVLAYYIYKQMEMLKKYFIPVIVGCLVGTLTSLASVILLSNLFGLNEVMLISLLPKSVTAPIALELSKSLGGISAITFLSVAISGLTGAVFAPLFIKILRIKNSIAAGVAIGTCSHAFGTSKAIEIGETEGAMSGLSIGIAGILTVIISLFL